MPNARTHPYPRANPQCAGARRLIAAADQSTRPEPHNLKSPRHPSSNSEHWPPSGSRPPAGSETAWSVAIRDGVLGSVGSGRSFTWRAVGSAKVGLTDAPVVASITIGGVRTEVAGDQPVRIMAQGGVDLDRLVSAGRNYRVVRARGHQEKHTCTRLCPQSEIIKFPLVNMNDV